MLDSIILGIIQGLTEFLPVSSSGHLVLFGKLLNHQEEGNLFEVLLHFGTLVATIIVFRTHIMDLVKGIFSGDSKSKSLGINIVIASIPTAIIGLLFEDFMESLFDSPLLVSCALIFTGIILMSTKFVKGETKDLTWKMALIIGFAQAMAITPGISRSGSTIAIALLIGLSRKEAGNFSFLISIPVIGGVTFLKILKTFKEPELAIQMNEIAGVIAAFITGYFALVWLMKFVQKGKLHLFSWYVWAAGLIGIVSSLL